MKTSVFDLFRIGIGPSSSHTVGPMRAAREFALTLPPETARIRAELYGSLALTGKGHATDRAILLGLAGETPAAVDPDRIDETLRNYAESGRPSEVILHKDLTLPGHPNGMKFTAFDAEGRVVRTATVFSTGGGFLSTDTADARAPVPFPFQSGAELLDQCRKHSLPVWRLMLENEKAWRTEAKIRAYLGDVWQVMKECVDRGLRTEGILPGGLNVRRRAPGLRRRLLERGSKDPLAVMDWVNVFAMAVNEENAAGGRVVTAPTNGAAGLIPAVGHYYLRWCDGSSGGIFRYLLAAGAIGVLYKENASISGAEVGCQGEVGVACSMAAAGLVSALDGTNDQVEHAAEIGMEHNLGMTCDPIGGLVQIPCIERNAIGAVKAINACRMAMQETEGHKVQLDQVIRTMYQTGLDMQSRYKETSLAGLAVNAVEC
ncbi:MAG TPA: L-serine ammonia-lyase [Bryobacteraceae bacterium]|nr:L-serine ammonia-lyase [Bryobacteraceae bacterium]